MCFSSPVNLTGLRKRSYTKKSVNLALTAWYSTKDFALLDYFSIFFERKLALRGSTVKGLIRVNSFRSTSTLFLFQQVENSRDSVPIRFGSD